MLKSLQIRNFRQLDELSVSGLGDLNLVVGRNNSGKSSFLEALRILCRKGNPTLLNELVAGRDENLFSSARGATDEDRKFDRSPLKNLFFGRRFPAFQGGAISIRDALSEQYVEIDHVLFREEEEVEKSESGEVRVLRRRVPVEKAGAETATEVFQALTVTSDAGSAFIPIDESDESDRARRIRAFSNFDKEAPAVSFLSTRFLHPDRIANLWDQAVLTNAEDAIIDALRLIEPDVTGLAFVKAEDYDRPGYISSRIREERQVRGERIALIKLGSSPHPIPLSSMGDGMLRVLQLLLAMYPAKGGYFLIDEFENGLHHSVQKGLWELLFELAKKLKIQVFATTHSNDCIAAFAEVAEDRSDVTGSLFRLKQISEDSKRKVLATAFTEDQLIRAYEASIDLR